MNIVLWIIQGWLAAAFLIAGGSKLAQSREELERRAGMGYVADRSAIEMKLLGVAEVLGAVGLVVPWLLVRARVLTPIAALCLAVLMLGAVVVHRRRGESATLPAGLFVLSVLVGIGRSGWLP